MYSGPHGPQTLYHLLDSGVINEADNDIYNRFIKTDNNSDKSHLLYQTKTQIDSLDNTVALF